VLGYVYCPAFLLPDLIVYNRDSTMNTSDSFLYIAVMFVITVPIFYYFIRERGHRKSVETELRIRKTELEESKNKSDFLEKQLNDFLESVSTLKAEKEFLESRIKEKTDAISDLNSRISEFERQISEFNSQIAEKESRISELNAIINQERKNFEEKLAILDEAKEKLGYQFENLGNRIFEDTTKKFTDKNKTDMETLLTPLRDQIKDFERKVTDTHKEASVDRASLKSHIESLKNLGEQMSREAVNLATALKGESQTQGAWGEIVLERTLEMSGLSEGREYQSQPSYKGSDGNTLRPDVVVHLPEGKDIIVDSKVSLTAYERYVSCEDGDERENHLRDHLLSLKNHIKELSSKRYDEIPEIKSLNYVLMFVPVESAFMVAIETETDLYSEAFEKNVIIVCPSTLLATLRTVHSIWQFDDQNANARKIAEDAGKMYDKFATFVNQLKEVGNCIEKSEKSYQKAINSLTDGRGNLVKRASDLRELGIKTSKDLPREFLERSQLPELSVSSDKDTEKELP